MPERYQDRTAQAQAIGRARHWLERLAQLAMFENVVLRVAVEKGGRQGSAERPRQGPAPDRDDRLS
ncbi:MAG TPA: hypothetical protein VLW53_12325 [Candidatus Eisenbacteria bacterium]|nr:hypothetical protein [Candidatus Eisenbacteria bacterium]